MSCPTKIQVAALGLIWTLLSAPANAQPSEVPVTREAVCQRVSTPPTLDGKLNDEAWGEVRSNTIVHFPSFWNQTDNGTVTQARLAWDDEALYFAALMRDKELRSFGTKRNDQLWNGDVFELFFKPSVERPAYYEFQVNPKSVILELPFTTPGTRFEDLVGLPPSGFTAVAHVVGTLDQPGDQDEAWIVEGRIPWSRFEASDGRPTIGDVWTFALCRYDYGPEGTKPLLMSSAPLEQPSFHRTEDYGKLTFTDSD